MENKELRISKTPRYMEKVFLRPTYITVKAEKILEIIKYDGSEKFNLARYVSNSGYFIDQSLLKSVRDLIDRTLLGANCSHAVIKEGNMMNNDRSQSRSIDYQFIKLAINIILKIAPSTREKGDLIKDIIFISIV